MKTQHVTDPENYSSNHQIKKFNLPTKLEIQEDRCLGVRKIPRDGDYIKAEGFGRVRLAGLLGEGGEGKIYQTDSGHACKIYVENRLTVNRMEKIALMADKKIEIPGVCWPLAAAHNSKDEFVGYLMSTGMGSPMQKCMFVKPLLEKNFPFWSRANLVQVALSWLEKVVALHDLNVILGDVNPLNFLVKSDKKIFFVDTDSYQVEGFPCPVGMANFTAPEIQGRNFNEFLRTFEHEHFAVATLLFMILFPGKPPYSHQGGCDPGKNIKAGDFPYPFNGKSKAKSPDGPWRFIWSNLPYKTKEAFHNCFANGQRLSSKEWLDIMNRYKHDIEKGHLDPDGEGKKIFPARFKILSGSCNASGTGTSGLQTGRKSGFETIRCHFCGKDFQVNPGVAKAMRVKSSQMCYDCIQVKKMERTTGKTVSCRSCGKPFLFSVFEERLFQARGWSQPARCPECRSNKGHTFGLPSSRKRSSFNLQHSRHRPSPTYARKPDSSFWGFICDVFENIF